MNKILEILIRFGPLLFGVLFLAPVLTEIMDKLSLYIPYLTNLKFSLIICFFWGTFASLKGSWV